MTRQEALLAWLNDAYAMEKNLVQVLQNHARDADLYPEVQIKLQEHLHETRHHAELVKGCIERLGGRTSALKSGAGTFMGVMQGLATEFSGDEIVKNALAEYAAEHLEIASYKSLIAAAQELGDQETARVCRQILQEEEEMARWLEDHLPMVTRDYLAKEVRGYGGHGAHRRRRFAMERRDGGPR